MSDRFTLDARAQVSLRRWDGESVVHHLLSNDTHRLADPAGWILEQLDVTHALAAVDLAARAENHCDVFELSPALDALVELGLIHRC